MFLLLKIVIYLSFNLIKSEEISIIETQLSNGDRIITTRKKSLLELFKEEDENNKIEELIERIEILKPYEKRVSQEVAIKMTKEFKKHPEKYQSDFNEKMFLSYVKEKRICGEIKIAAYELIKNSTKVGVFHVGVFVCGIEIHFHSPGLEYWIPKYFHTRFVGGHFKNYDQIFLKNKNKKENKNIQTNLSFIEIVELIDENFAKDYTAKSYNVITHNCLKFAKELIKKIADKKENEYFIWPNSVIFPLKKPLINPLKTTKKVYKKAATFGSNSIKRVSSLRKSKSTKN